MLQNLFSTKNLDWQLWFKKKEEISSLSKLWYFLFWFDWKCHNFERNKIRATVFLKWTDFRYDFFFEMPPKGMKAQKLLVDTPIYGQSVYDFTVALIILINHCNFFIDCVCSKGSLLWVEVRYEIILHILSIFSCYTLTSSPHIFTKNQIYIFEKKILICCRGPNY